MTKQKPVNQGASFGLLASASAANAVGAYLITVHGLVMRHTDVLTYLHAAVLMFVSIVLGLYLVKKMVNSSSRQVEKSEVLSDGPVKD